MLPFRQIGASVAVTSGTPAAVSAPSDVVLVSAPTANAATAYFSADPTDTAPTGRGIPLNAGQTLQVAVPGSANYWFAAGADLIVTPIEILRT